MKIDKQNANSITKTVDKVSLILVDSHQKLKRKIKRDFPCYILNWPVYQNCSEQLVRTKNVAVLPS